MSKRSKSGKPEFSDGSEQLELDFTEDGKHQIVPCQLWEDFKAAEFVKRWNAQCPSADSVPITRPRKQAGKPSYVIERERGIVT